MQNTLYIDITTQQCILYYHRWKVTYFDVQFINTTIVHTFTVLQLSTVIPWTHKCNFDVWNQVAYKLNVDQAPTGSNTIKVSSSMYSDTENCSIKSDKPFGYGHYVFDHMWIRTDL